MSSLSDGFWSELRLDRAGSVGFSTSWFSFEGFAVSCFEVFASLGFDSGFGFFFLCFVILEDGLTPLSFRPPVTAAL